ncbi:MAG: alpha/beta fold hydrolase [Planctomycetaceae bacterium]|nr:alpha/beta fold hydrolase [Planctomycetaceae bacterium]
MDWVSGSFLRRRARFALAMALALALASGTTGCATQRFASLRKVPQNPLADKLQLASWSGPKPSERTLQTLRRYGLAETLSDDPGAVLVSLQHSIDENPLPEAHYAFAELAYLAGKRRQVFNEQEALQLYGAAVTHSYLFLFNDRPGCRPNPYDPEFRGACDVYNTALESALRIVAKDGGLAPGHSHSLKTCDREIELQVVAHDRACAVHEFERFEFVSDYEVGGLTNHYHSYGLGVPLIAVRKPRPKDAPHEHFYPQGLSFPVTAFLRVHPEGQRPRTADGRYRTTLELHDPLASPTTQVGALQVPLESDLSTPLAYFLDKPSLGALGTLGLLRPEKTEPLRGLYMVRPYEPGKIPVLMVHGLWSSPITWMEMFNDLGSDPALRDRYQFWFYLYPTASPLWISAAELRGDLAKAREELDPLGADTALDQMVIVGHSMGGLLGRLQTIDSGDEFWRVVSRAPLDQVKAEPAVREKLAQTFYFQRNPAVKRLITIATPHQGSNFSNSTTQWVFRHLIRMPRMLLNLDDQLHRDNPEAFPSDSLLSMRTGIESLAPTSPILPVLYRAPRPPGIRHHNIVGVISEQRLLGKVAAKSDGIVKYESAHLPNVDSEIVVDANHVRVHRHPLSVLEVRRILLEHLADVRAQQPVQFADGRLSPHEQAPHAGRVPGYAPDETPRPWGGAPLGPRATDFAHPHLPPPATRKTEGAGSPAESGPLSPAHAGPVRP